MSNTEVFEGFCRMIEWGNFSDLDAAILKLRAWARWCSSHLWQVNLMDLPRVTGGKLDHDQMPAVSGPIGRISP